MDKRLLVLVTILTTLLISCNSNTQDITTTMITTEPNIESCEIHFNMEYQELIPINEIEVPYSDVYTNANNFISSCNDSGQHPLIINNSLLKTHQIYLYFDSIYPVEEFTFVNNDGIDYDTISNISIEISINGINFNRLYTDYSLESGENKIVMNENIKAVKLVIDDEDKPVKINNLSFSLGEGLVIKEETELSNQFLRTNGWTGADGIFTFDLNNGKDQIGLDHETTGFIFSDTFIGEVDANGIRRNFVMINNTFGYLEHSTQSLIFEWGEKLSVPESVLIPDQYNGSRARNLLDNDGLTISSKPTGLLTNVNEGTMWLSNDLSSEIIIDLKSEYAVPNIYIWNYNENPDYGVKEFELYESLNGLDYSLIGTYNLDKASGENNIPYTLEIVFNENITRYLKIKVTDTYSDSFVGLGKIMLFGLEGNQLFGEVEATYELTDKTANEESSRLWLQDGVVIDNKIYIFPILVKDYLNYFMVHNVSMVEMDIVDSRFDFENAQYYSTPLQIKISDTETIFFGAGIMDNRDIDGYIYIYGYKDGNGRQLVVSRFQEENIKNFNEWKYFDGENWTKDINQIATLKDDVSAELSVTYINRGMFQGKYMLVAMENTTSGNIVYSLSDTPYGPFTDFTLIYNTTENQYLTGAFTYNAKLHPNLSTDDKLIISYNVNTTNLGALKDVNIYYPRFISITEIKKDED
jgi:hypothetical protein